MGKFSEETIQKVWEKGKTIPGKNPNLYREDCKGNQIFDISFADFFMGTAYIYRDINGICIFRQQGSCTSYEEK